MITSFINTKLLSVLTMQIYRYAVCDEFELLSANLCFTIISIMNCAQWKIKKCMCSEQSILTWAASNKQILIMNCTSHHTMQMNQWFAHLLVVN